MTCRITELPRYVALNTAELTQAYISKSIEVLNWSPEPLRLGYDLVSAVETRQYIDTSISQLARDTSVTVQCYGTHICNEIYASVSELANEVYRQVSDLDLYVGGELAYGFKCWTGLQLILEKIPTNYLYEFLTDPDFRENYELSTCDIEESPDSMWTIHRADGGYPTAVCKPNENKRLPSMRYGRE